MKEIAATQFYEDIKNILAAARSRACRASKGIRYALRSELYQAHCRQIMRNMKNLLLKPYPLLLTAGLLVCSAGFAGAVDISTYSTAGCAFPGTGQSTSYTATFGEDHDYGNSASTMSFTIYNGAAWGGTATSSVTVDNRTGLMWVTNPVDAGISGTTDWEGAITLCEGLAYASFADWRLPNIKELVSIVDYSCQSPSINTAYFLNTQSSYYWSSTTTTVPSSSYAWSVSFNDGSMYYNGKTTNYYVRCVRAGP